MKKEAIIILILFFSFSNNSFCQNKKESDYAGGNYKNAIYVTFGGGFINGLKLNNYGELLLKSNPVLTTSIEVGFYRNIYKTYGITVGAGLVSSPFNFNFSFYVDSDNEIKGNIYGNYVYYNIQNINIFLLVSKYFVVNKKINIVVEGGAQLNFAGKYAFPVGLGYIYDDYENDISLEFFRADIYHSGPCLSFKSNLNFQYHISKRSILQVGITFNYSPGHFAEGQYKFSNLPFESYGEIKFGVNYLGLKAGYSISF